MSLRDCLLSAVDQGALTRAEAADLADRFDEIHAQQKMALGDEAAAAAAKAQLERELRYEAAEAARRAGLDAEAGARLKQYLQDYRHTDGKPDIFAAALNLLEHLGFAGTSSIAGRAKAIAGLAHADMIDYLRAFRRNFAGARPQKPLMADIVRELHGEAGNRPEAKAMATAWRKAAEGLRQRFNAAGGAIPKLDGWALPHAHDAVAIQAAGRAEWKAFVVPRLDLARMVDWSTGERFDAAGLDRLLDRAFDQIVSGGAAHLQPAAMPRGRGAVASQRADHRVLHFRSADDWLAYDAEFGHGDPIAAMFTHINGMAQDIAAMEILGPNPAGRIEWLSQVVQREAGRAIAGEPSLFRRGGLHGKLGADSPTYVDYRIKSVYEMVRGVSPAARGLANIAGNIRNLLASAQLGAAVVPALAADPVIDAAARKLSGLPITRSIGHIIKAAFVDQTREQAARSGMVVEEFLHVMGDHARYAGQLHSTEWSRWLADQTMRKSGLHAMTEGRRAVFALDFQATLADAAATPFEALEPRLKRTMEGYGIDRTDWELIRSTPIAKADPDAAGFLHPSDIARRADGPALPEVQKLLGITDPDAEAARAAAQAGARRTAEKVIEMIQGQTERAIPSGTAKTRAWAMGGAKPGTFLGEMALSMMQYKSFALSFTLAQIEAVQHEIGTFGVAAGALYAGGVFIGLTLAGAMVMQLKNIKDGKDTEAMFGANDKAAEFWMQAMLTGGGMGLFGDFLFADQNRFGGSLGATLAGPMPAFLGDAAEATLGNGRKVWRGEETEFGKDAVGMARRYTPLASSLWYTRAAYNRVLLDQLEWATNPQAARKFRDQARKLERERGQHFWWRPGEAVPDRPPSLFGG